MTESDGTNWIWAYYQMIQENTVVVGHWIRRWYEIVVQRLQDGTYIFDQKKANRAINFIERYVHHHEGPLAPGLLKLQPWQKAFVSVVYGIVGEDGKRVFREIVLLIGRKQGKTALLSGLGCHHLFDDGGYGSRVYVCAPKLDQARLCYEGIYQTIRQEPRMDKMTKRRRTDLYIEKNNSSAQPLAFSSRKSDGLNVSMGILDEFGAFEGESGLRQAQVIKSSQGARPEPLLFYASTANYVNDSLYDEIMKRATAVINGSSKETRMAPFLYMIDDISAWNDINELRKSLPNLGISVSVDYMLEEIRIAEGSLSKRAEFLTKYCNIKQNASQAWLEFQTVEKCTGEHLDPEQFRGTYCVGGIDLSQVVDLTSACVVIEKAGKLYVLSHFWMPESRLETATAEDGVPYQSYIERGFLSLSGENYVDYHDVYKWFTDLVEQYEILPLQVGYDRYSSQFLVGLMRDQYGFHMDDVYQGTNLTPVIREAEGLLKDGAINIGDNSLLQMHLLNTALKMEAESQKVKMIKVGKRTRIDGAAALMDALTVRQKWSAEIGEQLRNE